MNIKKLKYIITLLVCVTFWSVSSTNLSALVFNGSKVAHTNFKDELAYNGRVYSQLGEDNSYYEDSFHTTINQSLIKYKSQKNWIAHQVVKNVGTKKVLSDKWFYENSSVRALDNDLQSEYDKISKPIFSEDADKWPYCTVDKCEFFTTYGRSDGDSTNKMIADWGHVIGWRKIGRTWFFVKDGVITKVKTNARVPHDTVVYGYLITGRQETSDLYSLLTKAVNNNAKYDSFDGWGVMRPFSAQHTKFFGTVEGHRDNYLLVDQFTGKVIYNKWHAFYDFKEKNGRVIVKKFYMKADKHGRVAKGNYKGLGESWKFGNNGVWLNSTGTCHATFVFKGH